MIEVGCRCGAIVLQIDGEPLSQVYCHCADCQAAHGAAYALNVIHPADAVRIVLGEPAATAVRSTPRIGCPACRTHLFTEVASAGLRSINAYILPRETFRPQCHIHCADAVLPVVDDLPHYLGLPAAFGGSDATADW